MNVLIIYFSQTGGTEKIAETIKQGILNSGNTCESIKMKGAKSKELEKYDLIGIGAPTFYFREPVNVRNFIEGMKEADEKHSFIFCTHGSIIGNTFYHMNEELKKKGYLVIGSFDSYSASSLQFYPEVMHTINHPDDLEIEDAVKFGEEICNISLQVKNGKAASLPDFKLVEDTWWAKESKAISLKSLRRFFPAFKIDTSKCTKCFSCQEECPVDAINIETDPPEIQMEGCIFCFYCEKLCPEGAIEADWSLTKKLSRGNLQKYVNALKESELKGKFRPYIDYEKIV
ncbi:MAG: EFR1 family ferrodoxin [Promethearchaeota archaeon]